MLDLTRVKAITIDLDDTLWPVRPTIVRAEAALSEWLTLHAPAAAMAGQDRALKQRLREEVGRRHAQNAHDLSLLRLEAIKALLVHAGEPIHLAESAFEVFLAARQRVDLYADALAALAFLSARYPVVAVSNGNADVHRVGIGAYFRGAVSARDVGVAKPDAKVFVAAAESLGLMVHEVLHVGDDPHTDALGAMAAGMQAVWLNREGLDWPEPHPRPHAEVRCLDGLLALWPWGT